eukprot:3891271-Heterocapsa_arctica.AAC.1
MRISRVGQGGPTKNNTKQRHPCRGIPPEAPLQRHPSRGTPPKAIHLQEHPCGGTPPEAPLQRHPCKGTDYTLYIA